MSDCCSEKATDIASESLPEIRVNGQLIDETELARELQYHQASSFPQAVQQAGQALVIRRLLLSELPDDSSINEEDAVASLVEKNSATPEPSESDCRRYFEQNRERFKTETLIELDHILLAAPKDDVGARVVAEEKAKEVIAILEATPGAFMELVEEYSVCPSKKTGGSLGQIGKGQTVIEFEQQVMRLPEGFSTQPIETRYGFHVVRVNRKIEGKLLEYEMVCEKVKHYLTQKASQLTIQAYIQSLVEKADIDGIHIGFSDENIVI